MRFPTPAERYYRYVAWCVLLKQEPLSFAGWLWQTGKIPEHAPIGWYTSRQANA